MSSVSELMKEYFEVNDEASVPRSTTNVLLEGLIHESSSTPIQPSKIEWDLEKEPERFIRKFEFQDRRRLIDFLNEIFDLEDEMGHHADIQVSNKSVIISINTHTLEKVTELDVEFTRSADKILRDVLDYSYDGREND